MVYLRNKKDFDAGLLLSQSLSCKIYKTYTAAFYFKIVRKQNIRCPFKVTADQSRKQERRTGAKSPPEEFLPSLEKYAGHSLEVLDIVSKFGPLSEISSPPLVSQAGYGPAADATDKSNTVFVAWKG